MKGGFGPQYFRAILDEKFPNGDTQVELEFLISYEAIKSYLKNEDVLERDKVLANYVSKLNRQSDWLQSAYDYPSDEKFELIYKIMGYFLKSELFLHFLGCLRNAFSRTVKNYKNYTSTLYQTKKLVIYFREIAVAGASSPGGDFEELKLVFNISHLILSTGTITNSLSHELYHFVSYLHENQEEVERIFHQWFEKNEEEIRNNTFLLQKHLEYFKDYFKTKRFRKLDYNILVKEIEHFFQYGAMKFWNVVTDTTLTIIAIELNDIEYLDNLLNEAEEFCLKRSSNIFREFPKIIHDINQNDFPIKKQALKEAMKLIEFVFAYLRMPSLIMPISILGDHWIPKHKHHLSTSLFKSRKQKKANRIINQYKASIEEYFEPEIKSDFIKFYREFEGVVHKGKIHNNPLDHNIAKQIHDTGCIEQARKAHKILRIILSKYFQRLRETKF